MIWSLYDPHGDVLYLALDNPVPSYVEEGERGVLYLHSEDDDHPSGVTVIGFKDYWSGSETELASDIARFLSSEHRAVASAIASAIDRESV